MLQDLSTNVKQKDTLNYDFISKPLKEFDKEEIKREILSNIRSYLSYLYPNGTFHGNEFRVGDIYGSKGQSLRVTLSGERAGLWYDFNTEEKGDVITFWAIKLGKDTRRDFREIMSSLSEWLNYDKKCPKEQYINRKLDEIATYSWNYYDENGQVTFKVYRKDPTTANGKKRIQAF